MKEKIVKHYIYQRQTLGILCMILAPLCVLCGLPFFSYNASINVGWWHSVSETYYATSKMVMIGLLMSAGTFLLTYQGYDWRDKLVNKITGILAFGVVAFPCCIEGVTRDGFFNLPSEVCGTLHCIDAGALFAMFALNILWLFTKTDDKDNMTDKKKLRNKIYYICGIMIIVNLILMGLRASFGWSSFWVIIFENFMLMPFGFAWIVKGEGIKYLKD